MLPVIKEVSPHPGSKSHGGEPNGVAAVVIPSLGRGGREGKGVAEAVAGRRRRSIMKAECVCLGGSWDVEGQ
jgi:hypothetical protein